MEKKSSSSHDSYARNHADSTINQYKAALTRNSFSDLKISSERSHIMHDVRDKNKWPLVQHDYAKFFPER